MSDAETHTDATETADATTEPHADGNDGSDELTAAQERARTAETALFRERAVAAAGIPKELADRLQGETEEDLAADAKKMAKMIGAASAKPNMQTRPRPTAGGGASGPSEDSDRQTELTTLIRRRMEQR